MKHQYEDYIEWIDEKIKSFTFYRTKINGAEIAIASLLANKATLERFKPKAHLILATKVFVVAPRTPLSLGVRSDTR